MSCLYVCNTSSDCISKVNLDEFKEESEIALNAKSSDRVGPHGICEYEDFIITANSYSNNISIIDRDKGKEVEKCFIGAHCNDVAIYRDNAYIICGESNNVFVFDMKKKRISEEVPCGNLPHSIILDKNRGIILITNMEDESLTLIDCNNSENVKSIKVGAYPTKSVFTIDGKYILVCESNIGSDFRGSIAILSAVSYKLLDRIIVGKCPVDMYCNEKHCFVSNFGDGTISMLDINHYQEVKKFNVGGMPRGIIKHGNHIYVGDNYNDLLMRVDMETQDKKIIPIGGEPTGMILTNR